MDTIINDEIIMDLHSDVTEMEISALMKFHRHRHEQKLITKIIGHDIHTSILILECEILITGLVQLYEIPQYQVLRYYGDDYEMQV